MFVTNKTIFGLNFREKIQTKTCSASTFDKTSLLGNRSHDVRGQHLPSASQTAELDPSLSLRPAGQVGASLPLRGSRSHPPSWTPGLSPPRGYTSYTAVGQRPVWAGPCLRAGRETRDSHNLQTCLPSTATVLRTVSFLKTLLKINSYFFYFAYEDTFNFLSIDSDFVLCLCF